MIKSLSLGLLSIIPLLANANVTDCKAEDMDNAVREIITKLEPYKRCVQAVDDNNDIIGYKLTKNESYISIGYTHASDLNSELRIVNGEQITAKEFFTAIYSPRVKARDDYADIQHHRLKTSSSIGVANSIHGTVYFEFDSKGGPYLNSAYYFTDLNPNQFIHVGSDNKALILSLIF